jgi:hypothetical protein
MTKHCNGSASLCFGLEIFENLSTVRYVPNGLGDILYTPMYVYEHQAGDCKNTAQLFTLLMKSIGFKDSKVICSMEMNHCVSKFYITVNSERKTEDYIIVDLTIPEIFYMYETEDPWDYHDIYRPLKSLI